MWPPESMVIWMEPLYLPSLGVIGFAKEDILHFKFFMWPQKTAKRHVTPWVAFCHHTSPPCQFCSTDFVEEEISDFQFGTLSLMITWSELCLFIMGFASPYVNLLQSFGGHTSFERRNIWFLNCHVTSCDQVVRGTYDFLGCFNLP